MTVKCLDRNSEVVGSLLGIEIRRDNRRLGLGPFLLFRFFFHGNSEEELGHDHRVQTIRRQIGRNRWVNRPHRLMEGLEHADNDLAGVRVRGIDNLATFDQLSDAFQLVVFGRSMQKRTMNDGCHALHFLFCRLRLFQP